MSLSQQQQNLAYKSLRFLITNKYHLYFEFMCLSITFTSGQMCLNCC